MLLFPWLILPSAVLVLMSLPDPKRAMVLVFPSLALMSFASSPWYRHFFCGCSFPVQLRLFLQDLCLDDT
jgi:hypothetical protein